MFYAMKVDSVLENIERYGTRSVLENIEHYGTGRLFEYINCTFFSMYKSGEADYRDEISGSSNARTKKR